MDVRLLKKAIGVLHLNLIIKIMDLNTVIDEIYNVAREEMNFEIEANHLEEFRENNIDIAYVGVPKIYKNFVTKKVLVMEYINGVSTILRKNNIRLDKNITLLMRGICVIEGTLESISPDINLLMVLNNKIKENSLNQVFSKEMLINTGRNFVTGANSLSELRNELLGFVKDVNRGEIKFGIEIANSDKQVDKLEKILHQLVIGVLDAAVLLGASMVANDVLRGIYLFLAVVFSVWLFVQMTRDHFHRGY